ncbi:DNA polymerase III subunit beta [Lentibacillus cibarius]|uniref:Beta sliding clamp n=1 Tax=Lentibacillus cibarius TaxID=2583219 RepID=A0A5S3QKK6_9BACI|nr:DNA polymerase III subunit beta [Lentibacillus cibarius]TMN22279.1 DNA polymerase III subunit beta [Lentibacillus cibarius]
MKFVIQRDQLISSVQDVMKAISAKAAVPILTGMKIDAKVDGITLTGSDSDISIESHIPTEEDGIVHVEQIEEGSIVVQARYFPDIIRKLPEKTVEIEADSSLNVTIRSGKAKFNLNGQDADEYPKLPQLQTDDSFELQSDLLKSLIKQTGFAVSTMETRPILTGVNVKIEDDTLHFTATDSHRLAARNVPVSDVSGQFSNIVVPGKSLNELYKILDDKGEKVEISVTSNQILFRTKHLHFLSRLLDGNYPETSRLIPEKSQTKLHVKTKELIDTIDRASLLARDERNNVVKLTTKDHQVLQITSNSPEVGQAAEEVSVQAMEGEDLKISFSSRYMLDALKAIEDDEVIIEFTGAMRPFIIKPANGDPILQLILPVRTY